MWSDSVNVNWMETAMSGCCCTSRFARHICLCHGAHFLFAYTVECENSQRWNISLLSRFTQFFPWGSSKLLIFRNTVQIRVVQIFSCFDLVFNPLTLLPCLIKAKEEFWSFSNLVVPFVYLGVKCRSDPRSCRPRCVKIGSIHRDVHYSDYTVSILLKFDYSNQTTIGMSYWLSYSGRKYSAMKTGFSLHLSNGAWGDP